MKHLSLYFVILLLIFTLWGCEKASDFPELRGEYLGQTPPSHEPQIFAAGIISAGMYERDIAMTPDGKEIYFCVTLGHFDMSKIMVTKLVNGKWRKPEVAPFSGNPLFKDVEPFISPDGQKFYFASNRPTSSDEETAKHYDIWVMDRTESGWGTPYNLGEPVNSEGNEFFPSLTKDRTIYFTRRAAGERADHIFRSRLVNGVYSEPEKLGPNVNCGRAEFNAFIAPDESYLIVCVAGRDDSVGSIDYYITFRDEQDNWSAPVNLGDKINTTGWNEYSPYVSPDGKYFFFMSTHADFAALEKPGPLKWGRFQNLADQPENGNPDIYWVDASFIEKLKQK